MILSVRAALECAPCAACRPWEECLDRAPSTWAPNHIAETVSRRPRSPKPRKTKTRSGAKWLFNLEKDSGIQFTASGRIWRPNWSVFRRALGSSRRCCLSVVRGGLKPASRAPFPRLFSFSCLDSPCCWCGSEDDGCSANLTTTPGPNQTRPR